ncbi:MAG: uroporphyrinogen decarboxylase [Nitrospirota bacterium]|nr:uroporphyrinogen decarboxylase [Nitrospirota bacterium]
MRSVPLANDLFLRACRRESTDRPPVWIMRQAGRYMPEYQEIRKKTSFLGLCKTPELAADATLLPIDILDVDAAILFSDILIPVEAMGLDLEFTEHKGPRFLNPVRTDADIDKLAVPDARKTTGFVHDAVTLINKRLAGRVPLIGFSGSPFTLATYMVEGETSKEFTRVKRLMFSNPKGYKALMEKITRTVIGYLEMQIEAGIHAYQLFDTWAGSLSAVHYREFALPYTQEVVRALSRHKIPSILYVNGTCALLDEMNRAGTDVLSIDWRLPLDRAISRVSPEKAIQGNLDPVVLLSSKECLESEVRRILSEVGTRAGYIFNLGHGILPETPVEMARHLVKLVQNGL